MSSIVTSHGVLHFEIVGRGEPLILLHGWINSWKVWRASMLSLGGTHPVDGQSPRRVYALDFWGFGDSSNSDEPHQNAYLLENYVDMVREFMDNMGIVSAPIAGHSLGGTVALLFALAYPHRTEKVVVVGSPIDGKTLNPFLKMAGISWIARLVWSFPIIRTVIMKMLLAGDSPLVRQMISHDVEKSSVDSFFRSIGDLKNTDLSEDLIGLSVPALGIYGSSDNIVSPKNAELLIKNANNSRFAMIHNSRHFPMADEPDAFIDEIRHFLDEKTQL